MSSSIVCIPTLRLVCKNARQLECLALADHVPHGRDAEHDFQRGYPALLVGPFEQRLRDDRLNRLRKARPYLRLLLRREDLDDAVDGLGSGDGVQGRKHEMPRFRRFEGEGNGFEIAHFAHEDDVGSSRSAERSAVPNERESRPISRWFTRQLLD